MGFLSVLALVLLTLVGYSAGVTIACKGGKADPGLLDIAVVVAAWSVALMTRSGLGKWPAIGVWLLVGLAVGAIGGTLRRARYPLEKPAATPANVRGLRRLLQGWKAVGLRMGNYQSRVLLALFYFLVVLPFGIAVQLFSNPLRLRWAKDSSFWVKRHPGSEGIDGAREQF